MKDAPLRVIRFRGVVTWPWFGIKWLGRIGLRRSRHIDIPAKVHVENDKELQMSFSQEGIAIPPKGELRYWFEEVVEP